MNESLCTAVVMAGGFGTRLKPLTVSLPKPMVPVGNRPLMEHVIELLKRHGFTSIMSLLYFQPEIIMRYFGDGAKLDVSIRYLRPNADYGTAGSVRQALPELSPRFIVVSGDVLTDIDLTAAVAFHERSGAEATMVLTRRENPLAYGIVVTDDSGRIVRFLEKPSWGEVFTDTINTGIYILERSLLESWPIDQFLDFGQDIFPRLLADGRRLYGYVSAGYWRDVGNVNEYTAAHHDLLEGKLEMRPPGVAAKRGKASLVAGPNCAIADDAVFEGTVVLGERVSVGSRARISDSVIGPGSVIGSGAHIRRSVLWSAVAVGEQATINEAIVQTGVRLGNGTTLMERTIVSDLCRIGADVTIRANCRVWPRKRVEDGATVSSSIVWGEQYNRELFSDAKVTGLTNREMTPEFAARLGAAFASQFATTESVILARDRAVGTRAVSEALKSGIASSGVSIRDLRATVVPIVRQELRQGDTRAGIYVRCTPGDPLSTDAIFFDSDGFDLPAGEGKSIERLFLGEDFRRADPSAMGRIEYPGGASDRYRDSFVRHVETTAIRKAEFRIVVDYNGGLAGMVFPSILEELGVESIALNSQPRRLDPLDSRNDCAVLSRIVSAVGYDLGVSISTSAEKMTLIDRRGTILSSQRLLLVMASLYWRLHPGQTIAVPVLATSRIDSLAEALGGRVERVKNDHQSMMHAAGTGGVGFVGGTRGGFILPPWQRGADAMISAALLLEWLARTGLDFTEVVSGLDTGTIVSASIACPWSLKGHLMRRLMDETVSQQRQLIDGVRLVFGDESIWLAPDRRTAHFSLLAEATEASRAQDLIAEWRKRLIHWRNESETVKDQDESAVTV